MIYIGTSGFSYSSWKGVFYPDKLPAKDYLNFYSQHLSTTEINNTFYRFPSEATTAGWAQKVPESFRFSVKLNRRITHKKLLREVDEEMGWFLKGTEALGPKLGCLLVQLPPYARKSLPVLEAFLQTYSQQHKLALEFRHDSWFSQDTYDLLGEHGASLVLVETDEQHAVMEITGNFVYIRLRRADYSDSDLARWAEWLSLQERDVFLYMKHDDKQAPLLAQQLVSAIASKE